MKSKVVLLIVIAGFLTASACINPIMEQARPKNEKTPVAYTVVFDSRGGSPVDSLMVTEGEKATRPENPTKSGFGFVNWYDNEDLSEPHYDFNTPVTDDITLYAEWSENPYTVIFMDGETELSRQLVGKNGTASRPDPTKEGYTFDDWYSNSGLTTLFSFNTPITENTSVYAKFNINSYTVIFMDGGTVLNGLTKTVAYGSTVDRPSNPTKDDFDFINWYSNSGLTTPFSFSTPITDNTSVYAKFNIKTYTVTFMDGDTVLAGLTRNNVPHGSTVNRPPDPTKSGYDFVNWYSNPQLTAVYGFATPVSGGITLYAGWIDADFPTEVIHNTFNVSNTAEWNSAVSAISDGGDNKNYIINVLADFDVPAVGYNSPNFGKATSGIKVSFRGASYQDRTLTLTGSTGIMLNTNGGQTLILRDLILQGLPTNGAPLVYVDGGTKEATFIMQSGKICGNNYYGGGVVLYEGGIFIMNGGEISGNRASDGGGVYVNYRGTFTMNGGIISGNRASSNGGGVSVRDNGTFTMNGGNISGNTADWGGGVYVREGTFTMKGGNISGNTALGEGGGVNLDRQGTFTMYGGEISGNKADTYGGGVYVEMFGTLRIVTGTIYGLDEDDPSLRNSGLITPWGGGASVLNIFDDGYVDPQAEYGTFSGTDWIRSGYLYDMEEGAYSTHYTIRVENGVLLQGKWDLWKE
jgi:uncharacterized repeat protein (TIGR02543 family)